MSSSKTKGLWALSLGVLSAAALGCGAMAAQPAAADQARTEVKSLGDWQVSCVYGAKGAKVGCDAVLRVLQAAPAQQGKPASNRVVLIWTLSKGANAVITSRIEAQTGVLIAPGLQVGLDAGAARALPFAHCTPASCTALAQMDADFQQQAAAARKAAITVQAVDGEAYTYTFAPTGIDRALAAVR